MGPGLMLVVAAAAAQAARSVVPWGHREIFEQVFRETGQDENLMHALGWQESNLNPLAIGKPNENGTIDYGLMQINSANFADLGLTSTSWQDPLENTRAAAKLLTRIRSELGPSASLQDVISVYNAGQQKGGGPKKVNGVYSDEEYVVKVTGRYALVSAAALAPLGGS